MDRFIVKIAAKTVLILIVLTAIAFVILNFAFPQHMATLTEGIGNYSLSVKYTSLRYWYTGDGYDLARCVDDSILSEKTEYIIEYGEQLVNRGDFGEICETRDGQTGVGDYRHFVCGKLVGAYYDRGNEGDFDKALTLAKDANGDTDFKMGNPLMTLCVKVTAEKQSGKHAAKIGEYSEKLLKELGKLKEANPDEESQNYKNIDYFEKRLKSVQSAV